MQEGWLCPICRKVNAPTREQCCTAPAASIPIRPHLSSSPIERMPMVGWCEAHSSYGCVTCADCKAHVPPHATHSCPHWQRETG